MNTLSNILDVMVIGLYGFIICYLIWDIFKSCRARIMGLCPLTGTKAKSKSVYPLTSTELVNVTQASTKKEGGK